MSHRPLHRADPPTPDGRSRWRWGLAVAVVVGLAVGAWALSRPGARPTEVAALSVSTTTTTESTTTTSQPSTTTTAAPRRATLLVGGDVLIHQPVWEMAAVGDGHDFSPMLDPIASLVSGADLALCHLEVTLAGPGAGFTGYPLFRAPAALATDLAEVGFDGCSTSSNHALDYGASGVAATLDALDAAGLGHAGTARSAEEDRQARRYDAGGIALAHLSYSYGFNGFVEPADVPWLVDQIDPDVILADAAAARAACAELVVVSLHWGNEYDHDVSDQQQQVAEALAAQPGAVDLVVGHHAHVVQPISRVGDLWVVWGLGNMLSNNSPSCCGIAATDGLVATVTFAERSDGGTVGVDSIAITPIWNERSDFRVLPAAEVLRDPAIAGPISPELGAALRASYERTVGHALARQGGTPTLRASATLPPG